MLIVSRSDKSLGSNVLFHLLKLIERKIMRRKVIVLLAVPMLFLVSLIFLMSDVRKLSTQNDELLIPIAPETVQRALGKPFSKSETNVRETAPEVSNTSPSERSNNGVEQPARVVNPRDGVVKEPMNQQQPQGKVDSILPHSDNQVPKTQDDTKPIKVDNTNDKEAVQAPLQVQEQVQEKEKEKTEEQVMEVLQEQPKQADTGAGFGNDAPQKHQSINEPKKTVGEQPKGLPREVLEERRLAVKNAYLHSWKSYERYAWGHDELRPISKTTQDWLSMGLSIVDSIDTMYLMGLTDEYQKARDWIANSLNFDSYRDVSFFETTIRVVGGLVSIYDLTGDRMYIEKAEVLAKKLMPAFGTPTGIPYTTVNLGNGQAMNPGWAGGASILSEAGTVQIEYATLSKHTGNQEYGKKALNVFDKLDTMHKTDGLYSVYVDSRSGNFVRNHVTLGALGDSFYEYLLKMYLITDKKEAKYQRMYDQAMDAIIDKLIKTSSPSGLTYIAERIDGRINDKMDHLVCFAGAMFALGAYHNATSRVEEHMRLGKEITRTCHEFYKRQATGLSPELVHFQSTSDFYPGPGAHHYILRPETVESYFVLYWITQDPMYQDWGWEAFQAMEQYCRTADGYAGVRDVTRTPVDHDDLQQSFFMAETLKYLYLLFSPRSTISLDDYVFNTEAHPIKIWK